MVDLGIKTYTNLIHANFFFVDIVGLSDPAMSSASQVKKIMVLNDSIRECEAYKNTPKDTILTLPTGDGMCLGFKQNPESPLLLASQLHEQLNIRNMGKIPSEIVRVRIGLHHGNCFVANDINGNENVWGPGIIMCRRVMDFGDDSHILMTPRLAEDLIEMSDEFRKYIHPVHDFTVKHGQTILVYSAYGDDFGNPEHPTKGESQQSKVYEEYARMSATTMYTNVRIDLSIRDVDSMLFHHKRFYQISNITNEPIYNVLHGLVTDVKKHSLDDLNVRVYDEKNHDMKISSINVNRPDCKEFTTRFNQPVVKGETGKSYTLEYDVEEPDRYFENAFLIDCQDVTLSIEYPDSLKTDRVGMDILSQETGRKIGSEIRPVLEKTDHATKAVWHVKNNLKGQTCRIEW